MWLLESESGVVHHKWRVSKQVGRSGRESVAASGLVLQDSWKADVHCVFQCLQLRFLSQNNKVNMRVDTQSNIWWLPCLSRTQHKLIKQMACHNNSLNILVCFNPLILLYCNSATNPSKHLFIKKSNMYCTQYFTRSLTCTLQLRNIAWHDWRDKEHRSQPI